MSSLMFPAVRLLSALIKQKLEQMLFVMDGENNASTVKIIWFGCVVVVFVQTSESNR